MFLEITAESVVRANPNSIEETYYAAAPTVGPICAGYCCTSSSHQNTKPPV